MKKLVRDKIPTLMLLSGTTPKVQKIENGHELMSWIRLKILEEYSELMEALTEFSKGPNPLKQAAVKEELVDCFTILQKCAHTLGMTEAELSRAYEIKSRMKGEFDDNLVVEFEDK